MTFQEALAEHLAAIAARDGDRFAATVAGDPEARVVAPDGSAIVGGEAIVAAHRAWFAGGEWTFRPQVLLTRESEALGFALLEVDYREGSDARRFLLSVVFTREPGGWRLFYDQNTPLPAAAS